MSRWQEGFEAHPIHDTLRELRGMAETQFQDMEQQEMPEKRRFIKVIDTFEEALKKLDPELVPTNQLDALNTNLKAPNQNIWNQLTSYASNGNVAHLTTANDHLTNQLSPLSLLMAIAKRSVREVPLRGLEKVTDEIAEALVAKKDEIQEQYDSLAKSLADAQQELTKLAASAEIQRTATDAQLAQWQKQFAEAQERRGSEYSTWRDLTDEKAKDAIQAIIDKSKEQASEAQSDAEEKLDLIIEDATIKHKAILDLYELTAGDSVASAYVENANNELKQANTWRRVSVGFIVSTVVWLLVANFFDSAVGTDGNIIWSKLVTIISLTGVLLFGAAYSSQQSNRHRSNEKRTRWFALQVKAIDPFISSLESAQQQALKKDLSEKLFGNIDEVGDKDGPVINEHAWSVVVKSITDILGKLPKNQS
ncbi:hypothetical protein [Mariprofundus ferrooxydans]|uniref:hypothetical protein n=1 Tax=Mariprofundus ferrooxydans TaxID=314344 RepID=UPI0003718AF1|nr:hypothetical protein [Mariprofundus ferrooxydans]